ncbi:MAG TPA: molybdate ABC transporter permease subunit [Polyangiaceae bacterium]
MSANSPLALSLQISLVATLLAAAFGVAFGALLALRFRGKNLADALVTAPMVLPPTVLGYYLLVVLGRRSPVGHAFEALTGSSIVFTRTGAVLAAAIGAFPIVVKSSRAALEDVDPVYSRAARTLGASAARAFFTVQLPLAARGIVAAVMLSFARSLGDFGVTLMVAGDIPHETQTASLAIYDAIQAHQEGDAFQMVLVLSAIAVTILYVVNRLTMKH